MAIVSSFDYAPFDESDPDDFRPNSHWAMLVDPRGNSDVHVDNITLIIEEIAAGDRIPLHTHPINEVIVILEGSAEVTLGDDTQQVGPGTVVFVPAGTPHGTRNAGTSPIRIHAMFPSERIGIRYLERNPTRNRDRRAPASVHDQRPRTRRSLTLPSWRRRESSPDGIPAAQGVRSGHAPPIVGRRTRS